MVAIAVPPQLDVTVAEHGIRIREHERRLNSYNGSLERMADSVDGLIVSHAEWRATVRTWGVILSLLVGLISPAISGIVVYLLTQ
jgi:hypothetical protein